MSFLGHLRSIELRQNSGNETSQSKSDDVTSGIVFDTPASRKSKNVQREDSASERREKNESSTTIVDREVTDDRGNKPTQSLWIGNIPENISRTTLRHIFEKYGRIVLDKICHKYCFVNFEKVDSAVEALLDCHEQDIFDNDGNPVYIRFANPRTGTMIRSVKEDPITRRSLLDSRAQSAQTRRKVQSDENVSVMNEAHLEGVEWPNGLPPTGPKSQHTEISPPPVRRKGGRRGSDRLSGDIYRPEHMRQRSDQSDRAQAQDDAPPKSASHARSLARRYSNSSSLCNSLYSDSDHSARQIRRESTSSPLPWERNIRTKRDFGKQSQKQKTSNKRPGSFARNDSKFEYADPDDVLPVPSAAVDQNLDNRNGGNSMAPANILDHREPADLQDSTAHSAGLANSASSIKASRDQTAEYPLAHYENADEFIARLAAEVGLVIPRIKSTCDKTDKYPDESIAASVYGLLPSKSPSHAPIKRLLQANDDASSIRSDITSSSKASSRLKRCASCKRQGSDLSPLIQCSLCTKKYHSGCGDSRLSASLDITKFVCSRCSKRQVQTDIVSPPPNTSVRGRNRREQPLLTTKPQDLVSVQNLSLAQEATLGEIKLSDGEARPTLMLQTKTSPAPSGPSTFDAAQLAPTNDLTMTVADFSLKTELEQSGQEEALHNMNRYKAVTCHWWKHGDCWLDDSQCLYVHRDTGLLTPDGRRTNKHWTCFRWLIINNCPQNEADCLYSHRDTGLHTWRDGKASLRHITCYWWLSPKGCKWSDLECRYAHRDTGVYSFNPTNKREFGTAVTMNPPSQFSLLGDQNETGNGSKRRSNKRVPRPNVPASAPTHTSDSRNHQISSTRQRSDLAVDGDSGSPSARKRPRSPSANSASINGDRRGVGSSFTDTSLNLAEQTTTETAVSERLRATRSGINPSAQPLISDLFEAEEPCLETWNDNGILLKNVRALSFATDAAPVSQIKPPFTVPAIPSDQARSRPTKDPRLHRSQASASRKVEIPGLSAHASQSNYADTPTTRVDGKGEIQHLSPEEKTGASVDATPPVSSIKKCRTCSKIVFSGNMCKTCKERSNLGEQETSPTAVENTVRISHTPFTEHGTANIDATKVLMDDLQILSEQPTSDIVDQAPRPTLKRTATENKLFLPNKRSKSSMLFSHSSLARPVAASNAHSQTQTGPKGMTTTGLILKLPSLRDLINLEQTRKVKTPLESPVDPMIPELASRDIDTVQQSTNYEEHQTPIPTQGEGLSTAWREVDQNVSTATLNEISSIASPLQVNDDDYQSVSSESSQSDISYRDEETSGQDSSTEQTDPESNPDTDSIESVFGWQAELLPIGKLTSILHQHISSIPEREARQRALVKWSLDLAKRQDARLVRLADLVYQHEDADLSVKVILSRRGSPFSVKFKRLHTSKDVKRALLTDIRLSFMGQGQHLVPRIEHLKDSSPRVLQQYLSLCKACEDDTNTHSRFKFLAEAVYVEKDFEWTDKLTTAFLKNTYNLVNHFLKARHYPPIDVQDLSSDCDDSDSGVADKSSNGVDGSIHHEIKVDPKSENWYLRMKQTLPKSVQPIDRACIDCRRRHVRCKHRISQQQQQEQQHQEPPVKFSRTNDLQLCEGCQRRQVHCLHIFDDWFDPVRCFEFLRSKGWTRDSSRILEEWEAIVEAAAWSDWNSDRLRKPWAEVKKGIESNLECSSTKPTYSRTSKDEDDVTKKKGDCWGPVQQKSNREHLKSRGIMLESESEEDDYLSDKCDAPRRVEAVDDPLCVPPRTSSDIFRVVPSLNRQARCQKTSIDYLVPDMSRKEQWKFLRIRQLERRQQKFGNTHWEVDRKRSDAVVRTTTQRIVVPRDITQDVLAVPSIETCKETITFRDFIGLPTRLKPCLMSDGQRLAFRDEEYVPTIQSPTRSWRYSMKRVSDEDRWPVHDK